MADNHEFEVISKEVIFTAELENPLKLFTTKGHVLAYIIPVIVSPFSTGDAIISIGEQGKKSYWSMDTAYEDPEKRVYKAVLSDLYQTVGWGEGAEPGTITSGTVIYYCIYAKLSTDGEVEEAEE